MVFSRRDAFGTEIFFHDDGRPIGPSYPDLSLNDIWNIIDRETKIVYNVPMSPTSDSDTSFSDSDTSSSDGDVVLLSSDTTPFSESDINFSDIEILYEYPDESRNSLPILSMDTSEIRSTVYDIELPSVCLTSSEIQVNDTETPLRTTLWIQILTILYYCPLCILSSMFHKSMDLVRLAIDAVKAFHRDRMSVKRYAVVFMLGSACLLAIPYEKESCLPAVKQLEEQTRVMRQQINLLRIDNKKLQRQLAHIRYSNFKILEKFNKNEALDEKLADGKREESENENTNFYNWSLMVIKKLKLYCLQLVKKSYILLFYCISYTLIYTGRFLKKLL